MNSLRVRELNGHTVQQFPCWAYGKHGMGTYRASCYID